MLLAPCIICLYYFALQWLWACIDWMKYKTQQKESRSNLSHDRVPITGKLTCGFSFRHVTDKTRCKVSFHNYSAYYRMISPSWANFGTTEPPSITTKFWQSQWTFIVPYGLPYCGSKQWHSPNNTLLNDSKQMCKGWGDSVFCWVTNFQLAVLSQCFHNSVSLVGGI